MADSTLTYDNLIGRGPFKTFRLTLVSGSNVTRGTVLGYNTSTGKVAPYDSGGSNGLNAFYGIAVDDVDATSGDLPIDVYVGGEFKINGLTFDTSGDSATQALINAARALGCYLKSSLSAT